MDVNSLPKTVVLRRKKNRIIAPQWHFTTKFLQGIWFRLFSGILYRCWIILVRNICKMHVLSQVGILLSLGHNKGAIWPSLSPCTVINPILLTYLLTYLGHSTINPSDTTVNQSEYQEAMAHKRWQAMGLEHVLSLWKIGIAWEDDKIIKICKKASHKQLTTSQRASTWVGRRYKLDSLRWNK